MVCNKPRDQTGCKELKRQVISNKMNFSRGKSKTKQVVCFFFFFEIDIMNWASPRTRG